MKRSILLLTVICSIIANGTWGQDPQFTQFYANPLYLNPAFAGSERCPRVNMNYRNEWPGITGTYVTTSASIDGRIRPLQGGLGLIVTHDRAGESTINTTTASMMFAKTIAKNRKWSVRMGIQAGYIQKHLDWSKLSFGDQIHKRYGFIYATNEQKPPSKIGYVDFSSGIIVYSEKFYGGYAAHHMTQPDEYFISGPSLLPTKHTAHVGAMLNTVSNDVMFSPNLLYQKQENFKQVLIGAYLIKENTGSVGVWVRGSDSFITSLGVQQGTAKLGYSYDFTISRLGGTTTRGTHELSMSLVFPCKPDKKVYRRINCPAF